MQAIGNTPLIKLEHLSEQDCADIYVKFEGANPTGSMKDRMALSMIEGAEKRGDLKPGGKVVEYTGGSTGSSLAMVCAKKVTGHTSFRRMHFLKKNCKRCVHSAQTWKSFQAKEERSPPN